MRNGNGDPAARVRELVSGHLPGYRIRSLELLGEGEDNTAYRVNGELIVRFAKEADPESRAELISREARLLDAVAAVSPLPVPRPRFADPEEGCLAYLSVPGVPLLEMPLAARPAHAASVAATLGELLAALHRVPVDRVADLVDRDDTQPGEWLAEAAEAFLAVADRIPEAHRAPVEAFLASPPPDHWYTPVFSHNDLGIEHVLVDLAGRRVTGVIDWSDAAITDPAYDFGLLHRDLGPAALDAALRGYRADVKEAEALRGRAVFYARCSVFEDLLYGLETDRAAYVDKSLAALAWLFPAPSTLDG